MKIFFLDNYFNEINNYKSFYKNIYVFGFLIIFNLIYNIFIKM